MQQGLKERLVGAAVLVVIMVVFIPMLLTGPIDSGSITKTNIPDRPDNKFNSLKVRYLLKVEISKLAQTFPGAPRFLLWIVVRVRGSYAVIRSGKEE